MSKFATVENRKSKELQAFVDGATQRIEGEVPKAKAKPSKRVRTIFSIDKKTNETIVKITQRPDDFRPTKSAVVECAIRLFDALPVDEQIKLLRQQHEGLQGD